MHAEIIAIGDEIISGQTVDTNSQWLSRRLEELGIATLYHTSVGDELEPLADVFRQAIQRADVVLVTGGLGPTADDLTREGLARATGRQLVLDRRASAHIRGFFARLKRPMPGRNEKQAMFPAGSRMIPNPNGTAPGIDLAEDRAGKSACRVFVLPGVPAEMKEMWQQTVADALKRIDTGGRVIRRRRINCFGAGESQIEAMLPDLIRRGRRPSVGINASRATIILRIAAEGDAEAECLAAMEPTVAEIRKCLGPLVFGEEDQQLQDVVVELLLSRKRTLATAEWSTAGLVTEWLDRAAGAGGPFLGGLVAACPAALENLLGIPGELIEREDSSAEVARAMAVECRRRFGADYGLAVGRFPVFDAEVAKPPDAFIALADGDGVRVESFPFGGHPALLLTLFAKRALNLARLAMLDEAS